MKRRLVSAVIGASLLVGLMAGCGSSADSTESGTATQVEEGKIINAYVYQDSSKDNINDYYPEVTGTSDDGSITYLKDGTEIHWIVNASEVFQEKLDEAIRMQDSVDADQKIDLVMLEADYVKKYVLSGALVSLSELGIPTGELLEQYPYTQEIVSKDGEIYGSSLQATPGLFAYRRSIAKDVLGTDDPDEVGKAVSTWDQFDETAKAAKEKGYYMLSGFADAFRVFSNNISRPWVSDNQTVEVDPEIMRWIEMTKRYTDAGYNHKTTNVFTDDWMKDQGVDGKVFGFFYSTWGINFTLVSNAGDEGYGDWAVCKGPQPFYWGGTWYAAVKGTDNPEHLRDIIETMTADRGILRKIAIEKSEFVNNSSIMQEMADDPDYGVPFLSGQNHLKQFADVAPTIDMKNSSIYDQGCILDMIYAFQDYFMGTISLADAKSRFETAIIERYPNLTKVVWPDE